MAKRKQKGKPQPQTVQSRERSKNGNNSRTFAYIVIGVAFIALIGFAATSTPTTNTDSSTTGDTLSEELAPPMTGVQDLQSEVLNAKTSKFVTFKLDELAGTDCVQSFLDKVQNGGVGKIRANYDRRLLEVQYDPNKQTETKLADALIQSNHPSKITTERIGVETTTTTAAKSKKK